MTRHRDNGRGSQALCDAPVAARKNAATCASPLRWYGGLRCHATRIARLLPTHDSYAEPFAGSAAVLLSKPAIGKEYLSDINPDLVNFWRVLKRPDSRRRLIERVALTPYARSVYGECIATVRDGGGDAVLRAWSFLVVSNQSRNGHGIRESYWSYGKGSNNGNADSWARLPERLDQAGRRLRCVRIECQPYERILEEEEFVSPKAVLLLDPPFLPSVRVSAKVYRHEFGFDQHQKMVHLARSLKARVILCGYRSPLYSDLLDGHGWRRTDFKTKSFAAPRLKGRKLDERVLSVWTNFVPQA